MAANVPAAARARAVCIRAFYPTAGADASKINAEVDEKQIAVGAGNEAAPESMQIPDAGSDSDGRSQEPLHAQEAGGNDGGGRAVGANLKGQKRLDICRETAVGPEVPGDRWSQVHAAAA